MMAGRKKRRKEGAAEEATFLDLLRTSDVLARGFARALKGSNLSPAQYNVLRILRGSREGLPCGEIAARLITRDPDITRLLDRLEKRRLIARRREDRDRRTVLTQITPEGLRLLERLDRPVREMHRKQLSGLGLAGLQQLAKLLEAARRGAE